MVRLAPPGKRSEPAMIDERPSLPERYAGAIESSHLEVVPRRCDVDYLVAAGWTRDSLGAMLYRLRTEYDAVRGERQLAILNEQAAARMASSLIRAAAQINAKRAQESDAFKAQRMAGDATRTMDNAQQVAEEARRSALTSRALIMVHLKTLPGARAATHGFARIHALRSKFMAPKYRDQEIRRNEVVAQVAARALDVWIDPACPHCQGRGFHGGYTEPVVICQECGGTTNRLSGRRGERLGKSEHAHQFGLSLLAEMDRKAEKVEREMRRYMAGHEHAAQADSARRVIQARLAELRSAAAQED